MMLRSSEQIVHVLVLLLLMLSALVVDCNKYGKNSRETGSCRGEFCKPRDEYNEPCIDDDALRGDPGSADDEPSVDEEKDDHEEPEDESEEFDYPEEGLFRWDPVKVGHTRELELEPDRFYTMTTRASDPPIFEIPGFLTDEECEGIINRTKKQGLFTSHVHIDPESREYEKQLKGLIGHAKSPAGKFFNWDLNKDGVISKEEVKNFAAASKYLYLNDEEVDEMINKIELTEFDDGVVTREEFKNLRTAAIEKYFLETKESHPKHRDRYSHQTWMPQRGTGDQMLRRIRRRVAKLTRLPFNIIAGGEHLQVVHYNVNGHYHAHYDSQSNTQFPQFKCCHHNLDKLPECRLCRYITVLYYLNQPEAGGETAFPAADVDGFNETEFRLRKKGDKYNLSKFCHNAALVIPPKRGTAIMWYNHYLDDSGWLGDLDWKTLHGGCDILKGEKWIANNWLTAANDGEKHIPSNYYIKELEDAEDEAENNAYDSEEDE